MKWIMKIQWFILKFNGLTAFNFENNFTADLRRVLINIFLFIGGCSVSMTLFSDGFRFLDKIVSSVNILCIISGIIKIIVYGKDKKELEDVTYEIFDPKWHVSKDRYIFLVVVFYQAAFFITILWGAVPVFLGFDILPFPMWTPFQETQFIKLLKFLFSQMLLVLIILTNLAGDSSYMLIACLIRQKAQSARIELVKSSELVEKKKSTVDKIIQNFVRSHEDVLRTVKLVENYLNIIFLLQVIATTLMICFNCLSWSQADNLFDTIKLAMGGMVLLFQLFLYCLFGQVIHDEFELLHSSMFWTNWFDYSLPQKKSILICQSYTSREVWLKGGAIFTVSLQTFRASVRESMSYYMFLRTLLMKDRQTQ